MGKSEKNQERAESQDAREEEREESLVERKGFYATMPIPKLFFKLFIPTFLGLFSGAMLEIADAMVSGRGINSDALAAINISSPLWFTFSGLGLMFGVGVSIIAAPHLALGKFKAANKAITNAYVGSAIISAILLFFIIFFPHKVNAVLDGSPELDPYLGAYLRWMSVSFFCSMMNFLSLFIIRLDGAVKYAMWTNAVPMILNIVLNIFFVFVMHRGIEGIGWASSIGALVGFIMSIIYYAKYAKALHPVKPKFVGKYIKSMWKESCRIMTLGFSTFLGETAISGLFLVGNYMFMENLHEKGVAAFSVACALLPIIFMLGNAAVQSAIPIITYNHAIKQFGRIRQTVFLSIVVVVTLSMITTIVVSVFHNPIVSVFIKDSHDAFELATKGLPIFSTSFILFALNVLLIGFYQSLENVKASVSFMLLRGFIILIPCFIFLPSIIGTKGLWLALPISEMITTIIILIDFTRNFFKRVEAAEHIKEAE